MDLTHPEHIRIAVKSLESSILYWENVFGLKCSAIEVVPGRKVRIAFFKIAHIKIELIESSDTDGFIGQFIDKDDDGIQNRVFALKNRVYSNLVTETTKLQLIDEQSCKDAIRLYINFLHPELTFDALTELCEN
jgi:methylmalonyl-CoA/ethylmalonyl-CoA epimerase